MRVELNGITVRFGPVTAVDDVSLGIEPGEIHALVGENGAGKSTLMNLLFGLVRPAAGTVVLDGVERRWSSPQDAIASGLGMVHQHFMLQDTMTVLENIVLCAEPVGRFGFVDFAAARRRLDAIAAEHGIAVDLTREVGRLSVSQRQTVEILKVLYREAELVILDEPTAVLTPQEKDRLFDTLRNFRAAGKSIVIITHKLDEVMEIADRVSVMRAGRLVRSSLLDETSRQEIARGIVGGELPEARTRKAQAAGDVVLSVRDATIARRGRPVGPVSFDLRAGEIVGIAGVSGNGQSELVRGLTGLDPLLSGGISLCGQSVETLDVAARRAHGMSYIPEDRQRMGLALGASVSENANAGRDDRSAFTTGPFLRHGAMMRFARAIIEDYRIRVAGPSAAASTMSGGNKQKLVVGRELTRNTAVVVAENPTWGVDIGAIDFIHGELMRMRDSGHAILLISTELDEVIALSDRILVMYDGAISGEVSGGEANREDVGALMMSRGKAA
ncbi:putative ABC transporter ATP-binding protein [Nitratireductor indicus C115]|uniref:Putative ABC transporter ATP-binding protein n=1 Tax=Nitratireductor indicus C115 TaxID=1231190 RepID=K2NU75_9HYPH|nr:ABC transporter ATP-binding protein [Nitratireductor indicus]EKF41409.1 putative ABC transporter ATP-binding protein [Nitratireductor indicus C115]SFQ72099.1 simple sugar transport system ATP-binding protein [Nitratireductor indicus]